MEHPVRALTYSRVSANSQQRNGAPLDTQEQACREHAHSSGMQVVESIKDTTSGFTLDRPGVERLR